MNTIKDFLYAKKNLIQQKGNILVFDAFDENYSWLKDYIQELNASIAETTQ